MSCSVINITFSAGNLEGVNKYAELVYANVTYISGYHMAAEKIIETTVGPNGSYHIGHIQLVVADHELNSSLVQLDAVEAGYVEGAMEVLDLVFGDARVEVVHLTDDLNKGMIEINQYLHDKVQEQSKALALLEMQLSKLAEQVAEASATSKNAQARIDGVQGYLLNYVDLNGLVKIVRNIAEKVDEDILEESEVVKVH